MTRPEPAPEPLLSALRALAEEDVSDVIAEARQAARTRAQKLIEDALVEELLQAAARLREPTPHEVPAPVREPTAPRVTSPSGEAWWTFGVLSARDAPKLSQLEGIEPGSAVEVRSEGELAALVSAVPLAEYGDERLREHLEDLDWVERIATRHEAVLDEVLQRVTVVPLRLCTLYQDLDGIRRFLRDHRASLAESLARVGGCAEWGVKVFSDPRADGAALGDAEGPAEELGDERETVPERPGATYLVQRQRERERAGRAAELRASCVEAVHDRVSRLAREATRNPPQRPEVHGRDLAMLLNGAYLVAGERVAELHETLRGLQDVWGPSGFVVELTGPWPAYNFVSGGAGVMP